MTDASKMTDKRELTPDEMHWCRRLERVLKAKPRRLYVYVGLGNVDILFSDDLRNDDDREMGAKVIEFTKYGFAAEIEAKSEGGMMDDLHETLTDLWVEIMKISQPERDPISFYFGDNIRGAIKTVAEQIRQQQRERVEKLEEYLVRSENHCHCGSCKKLRAAFKELKEK